MNRYFPIGYNPFLMPFPYFPQDLDVPPTLYALMNSIVNYGKQDKTKIRDLAKSARETIFDFDYPLTPNISRETFETNILKHFMTRRIGFETFTAFQIELDSKLNEIMPKYNILFDSINNWDLFKNGLTIEKIGEVIDNKKSNISGENEQNVSTNNEIKNRHSDLPQSELQDVDDEQYINIYEKNNSDSKSNAKNTNKEESTQDSKNNYKETVKHSQADLVSLYTDFQNNVNSVYTLLYHELECLFYGLV